MQKQSHSKEVINNRKKESPTMNMEHPTKQCGGKAEDVTVMAAMWWTPKNERRNAMYKE
jgi:hypothetical protein